MNDKISFPDLVTLLSTKLNISKKEADSFLKELFALAAEVIATGEELTIDGLGRFKPVWVEARNSVNVQTGEPVEIPGHYKLSFLPDKALREAVNAPFSFFSVEELNDHVSLEDMLPPQERTVEEEVAPIIEEEMGHKPPEVETEDSKTVETEKEHDEDQEEDSPIEGCWGDVPDDDLFYEAHGIENPRKKKVQEETSPEEKCCDDVPDVEAYDMEEPFMENYHRYFWRGVWSGIGVWILVHVLFVVGYFICCGDRPCELKVGRYSFTLSREAEEIPEWHPESDMAEGAEAIDTIPLVIADTLISDTAFVDTVVVMPVVEPDTTPAPQPVEKPVLKAEPKRLTASKATPTKETIRSGVFLTTLSLRHYGHKAFWVYIYEENKAIINNPDNIPIGTVVVIPEASKYGIDANDTTSINRAKALQRKIKGKQ